MDSKSPLFPFRVARLAAGVKHLRSPFHQLNLAHAERNAESWYIDGHPFQWQSFYDWWVLERRPRWEGWYETFKSYDVSIPVLLVLTQKPGEIYNPTADTWTLLPGAPVAPMLVGLSLREICAVKRPRGSWHIFWESRTPSNRFRHYIFRHEEVIADRRDPLDQ